MTELHDGMRESVAEFLPKALERALLSYHDFVKQTYDNEDAASFKKHHEAVKPVLAHIELLLKLAVKAEIPVPEIQDKTLKKHLDGVYNIAQDRVDQYTPKE